MDTKFDDFKSIDIDWYFLDRNFNIASLASGGGKLPMFVFNSMKRHQILQDYFNNSGFIGDFSIKYKFINRYPDYSSFTNAAKKGLFSFDKEKLGDSNDYFYNLISVPLLPLNALTLPKDILDLLSNLKFDLDIQNVDQIDIMKFTKLS